MSFILEYQELIGALLGAAVPISLWLLSQWYEARKRRYERVQNSLIFVVANINSLLDTRSAVIKFINGKLSKIVKILGTEVASREYVLGSVFFPRMSTLRLSLSSEDIKVGSGYIENALLQLSHNSSEIDLVVSDMREQLMFTVLTHKEMCLGKVGNPVHLNKGYKENIESYIEVLKNEFLEKNFKVYLKNLVRAEVALKELHSIGLLRWRRRFTPLSFVYFKTYNDYFNYQKSGYERADKFFQSKVEERIKEIMQDEINEIT